MNNEIKKMNKEKMKNEINNRMLKNPNDHKIIIPLYHINKVINYSNLLTKYTALIENYKI